VFEMKKLNTKKQEEIVMGIDSGTSTSQMAFIDSSGIVQVLPNMDGDLTTPSVVSIAGKKPVVGKAARQDRFFTPDKVAEHFKKSMGTVTETGEPIPIITGSDGSEYTAITLTAEVIRYLKDSAEKQLGQPIARVVISVPAYFGRTEHRATKEAGLIAGFKEVYIVDEPTAGATFYGLAKGIDQKIAVFDYGGGTFDICLLQLTAEGAVEPLGVDGDPECGGSNVDEAFFQKVIKFVEKKGGKLDPDTDLADWFETLDKCKEAKEMLAHKDTAMIPLKIGSKRYSMDITNDQLKTYCSKVIQTITDCCKRALKKAKLKASDIDCVVAIGGSSRLQFVSEIIKEVFGQDPVTDTDPDMAVAKGNAILAAAHFGDPEKNLLIEGKLFLAGSVKTGKIAGQDLCVAAITRKQGPQDEKEYNVAIIPSGTKLPYKATQNFTPMKAQGTDIQVKLIDGRPGELSSDFKPLQEAEVAIQPTSDAENSERIEFIIAMDIEGMVEIKVRDTVLNKPVPLKFKFHTGLSEAQIDDQRNQLLARHSSEPSL